MDDLWFEKWIEALEHDAVTLQADPDEVTLRFNGVALVGAKAGEAVPYP